MKRILIFAALVLAACAPPAATAVLPQFASTPTPYIDPSYPTARAAIAAPQESVAGIDVRVDKAWVDGKNLNANICFALPDQSDWSIYAANLDYGTVTSQDYGTTLLSLKEPANGQPGERCDTLTFEVPPDADLSSATIVIDSIGTTPRADEYCSAYMPKIQQALMERGIGIVLDCVDVNGLQTMKIMSMPPDMNQQQAEQIVYSDEFFTVKGPWTFALNLSR